MSVHWDGELLLSRLRLLPGKSFRSFNNQFICVILLVVEVVILRDSHWLTQVKVAVVEQVNGYHNEIHLEI
jgi:hypothetical protein